ncbi:MAG: putative type II secretion system protein F [Parcubacteria group bacterium ADurb.Bin316]|nr:MAG: putative type II secretion system protein F [Parcubacteria group bacterium ADurb.Bin316]HOZ56414.1 type II secretion system F family protein [bacterium]
MAVNFSAEQIKKDEQKEDENKTTESLMNKINGFLLKLSRIPLKEKLFFVQQLGVMLKAGISLSAALKTLAKQTTNKYFISILKDVSDKVEKGVSFAESLQPHKKIFGEMFINMVETGELSGKLEEVLEQLFIQMKKEHALISKVKGALTYPAVIVLAMGGIGTFMMVKVVPQMTSMFTEMNAELPLPTKVLINVSNAIANNGIISLVIATTAIVVFIYTIRTPKGKYYFQALLLKMPVFGPIIKKINIARFARNISSLLKTDIMIIKSFQITASVLGNLHYRAALEDMAQKIKKGGKLSDVINSYPKLFTPVVAQMVAVGEETGELDNILEELAQFYEEEVDNIMENLPSVIEPILVLALGIGVGAMAVAIIMPMYSITSSI